MWTNNGASHASGAGDLLGVPALPVVVRGKEKTINPPRNSDEPQEQDQSNRTTAQEMKLVRKAIRRLSQHKDNKGAFSALRQIDEMVRDALSKNTLPIPVVDPSLKQYLKNRRDVI